MAVAAYDAIRDEAYREMDRRLEAAADRLLVAPTADDAAIALIRAALEGTPVR